jgi:hypothetical protein
VAHPYLGDVLWSDVSEFQTEVTDLYPFNALCIRSNDGTHRDRNFMANYAWSLRALAAKRLKLLIVYAVYRDNWQQTVATMQSMVGTPHRRMAVMIDVESWGGQITGNHSPGINAMHTALSQWLGSYKRVIGYGNTGDLNALWPVKPVGVRIIEAAYGSNPDYPGKIGHQFTDGQTKDRIDVPPFGYADADSADGYDIDALCAALGIAPDPAPALGDPDMPANEWQTTPVATQHAVCFPVGEKVSSLITQGWLSIFPAQDADVHVELYGGGLKLAEFTEKAPQRDRWWKELPDGTEGALVTIATRTNSVAGWCLELKPKASV